MFFFFFFFHFVVKAKVSFFISVPKAMNQIPGICQRISTNEVLDCADYCTSFGDPSFLQGFVCFQFRSLKLLVSKVTVWKPHLSIIASVKILKGKGH